MYTIRFAPEALNDIAKLKRNEPKVYAKLVRLIEQLAQTPYIGLGKPEALRGNLSGLWSRRITDKHRLVYKVEEETVVVMVLSAYGHYGDK